MNFGVIQKSLIAFQNDDQDELFNFYDNRNKMRLLKLKKKAMENTNMAIELKKMAGGVLKQLNSLIGSTGVMFAEGQNKPRSNIKIGKFE